MNNKSLKRNAQALLLMLHEIAKAKGLSHEDIANDIGWDRANVTRILNARYLPRLDNFLLLSKAIGVNFFFECKNSETDLTTIFEKAMTQLGRRELPDEKNN